MVRFKISYNNEHLKTYELNDTSLTVGRLPENTISIANMGISRRHFGIEMDPDRNYVLTDLSSLNGTFVNGKKVKTTRLSHGDTITVGKYSVTFEILDGPQGQGPVSGDTDLAVPDREETEQTQHATGELDVVESAPQEAPAPRDDAVMEPKAALPGQAPTAVLIETTKHVVYKLEKKYMTVGNSENDDVFVSGPFIGDNHVVIEIQDDGTWIKTNKVLGKFKVNGKKEKAHRLEHKDRIEIGNSTFRYMENE